MSGRQQSASARITVHSVAERAGVSIATVSRVMSNHPTVNPEMAQRVRKAAAELGYRPSVTARGLASGKTSTVGLVVPDLGNPHFSDIIKAVTQEAAGDGIRTLIADSEGDPVAENDLAKSLLRGCDGVILISSRLGGKELGALAAERLPVVLANRVEAGVGLPCVYLDNYTAMLDLVGHLVRLGHKRLAYLTGPVLSWQERERKRAVRQAKSFGVEVVIVDVDGATTHDGYTHVEAALKVSPTAIMCFNDLSALGVMARLAELGVRVPADISVTGFDDITLARYWTPSLTTVSGPQGEVGRIAWTLMSEVLAGRSPATPEPLRAPLVERASTGPARA